MPTDLVGDAAGEPAAPAFAAAYTAIFGSPTRAASEMIVTTRPQPPSIIPGSVARVAFITP